jgi:hypothetical protein
METLNRKYIIHITVWVGFIVIPLLVIPSAMELLSTDTNFVFLYFSASFLSIVLFYFNYFFAIPKFFFTKKYLRHFLLLAVAIFISILVLRFCFNLLDIEMNSFEERTKYRSLVGAFIPKLIIVLIASYGIRIFWKYKELQNEKMKSELQFLKAQINPHFLFNTLNTLYGLASIKSNKTASGIKELSSIMRYVTTEANEEKVPLEREIQYIKSYIDLQKLRLTENTKVNFRQSGDFSNKVIAPLILITFIENSFKYGVSTERQSIIDVDIQMENEVLKFEIQNTKALKVETQVTKSEIGLNNTLKRLELIYNGLYDLAINEDKDKYHVLLKINLNK